MKPLEEGSEDMHARARNASGRKVRTSRSARIELSFDEEKWTRIEDKCREKNVTPGQFARAAINSALSRERKGITMAALAAREAELRRALDYIFRVLNQLESSLPPKPKDNARLGDHVAALVACAGPRMLSEKLEDLVRHVAGLVPLDQRQDVAAEDTGEENSF